MVLSSIILGVDPGFSVTGFSVIKCVAGSTSVLDFGYLKLKPAHTLSERVGEFYKTFQDKIGTFGVTDIALETSFLGQNAQTFLKLGYLRGILYLLADQHKVQLHEFAPREVKLSVTGMGNASKEQVALMMSRIFPHINSLQAGVKSDVTDALAIALCGVWSKQQKALLVKIERLK